MVNAEDEEWNASCMSHHRPQSAKTRRFTSLISNGFFCYNRRAHEVDEQIAGPSATERTVPSSIRNEHSHSRREGEQVSTTELDADNNGWKSVDTVVAGQTSTGPTEIERLQRDLSVALSRIAELQKRYEAQSKDLEVSNSFFNIADKSSDSDIIRALQRLNAEVQQNATYMADSLVQDFEFKSMATDTTEKWTSLVRRVSGHIGLVLANALRSSPQEVLLFLQIALQVHLVTVLGQIASAWALDAGHNSFIDGIYQTLRGVGERSNSETRCLFQLTRKIISIEAQATAGRWRALARLYNFHDGVSHPESVVKRVITDISDIVLVAGCTASQSDIIGTITSKFEDRLTLLVTLAGHLNKSFNEVISSDFEVFLARPGDAFQSKNMEESDEGQARGQERSVVLCTTHLGLLKQVPVGTLWEKGKKQEVMVLKAKVLPESFLDTENT